jgi:four helix bundle protein
MSGRIERFEDLIAWQKARVMTGDVYRITLETPLCRDFGLKDQERRAAISIVSIIAEEFERNRSAEFHQFLSIAKASCAELRSQMYIALDAGYLDQDRFNQLLALAIEVGKIIGGLRASVEKRRDT